MIILIHNNTTTPSRSAPRSTANSRSRNHSNNNNHHNSNNNDTDNHTENDNDNNDNSDNDDDDDKHAYNNNNNINSYYESARAESSSFPVLHELGVHTAGSFLIRRQRVVRIHRSKSNGSRTWRTSFSLGVKK